MATKGFIIIFFVFWDVMVEPIRIDGRDPSLWVETTNQTGTTRGELSVSTVARDKVSDLFNSSMFVGSRCIEMTVFSRILDNVSGAMLDIERTDLKIIWL